MGFSMGDGRNFVEHRHHLFRKMRVDYVETPRKCVQVILKLQRVVQKSEQEG